jgi:hypothetical protein
MKEIPITGESLEHTKQTADSETIRSDSQISNNLELGAGMAGDINFELVYTDFIDLITAVMRDTATVASVTSTAISFDAATQQIKAAANPFTAAAGFAPYIWLDISGAYNDENNGLFRCTVRADGALTVANGASALVAESVGASVTVKATYLRNGTTDSSFLLEKQFLDIGKYVYYPGCVVGGMTLNINALDIVKGSFNIQGQQGIAMDSTIAASVADASTDEQVTASANVGMILVDGVALAVPLRAITLTVDNGLRTRPWITSKFTSNFGRGSFKVSGTIEAYFEDHTLYNKLIDHTPAVLSWKITDVDGNVFIFTVPKAYFNAGSPNTDGRNNDYVLPLNFDAPLNSATGYGFSLQIDMIAA